jgi:hypothetical protein
MRVFTIRFLSLGDGRFRSVLETTDPEWRGSLLLFPAGDKEDIGV